MTTTLSTPGRAEAIERARLKAQRRVRTLVTTVRERGGIIRTRTMADAGFSKHYQSLAVASGQLERVGRSWLALPGSDEKLLAAARAGVVTTCLTAAERLGLWVVRDDRTHVAVAPHGKSRRLGGSHHVHWSRPPVPRDPDAVSDPIENVLAMVAECRPHDEALAIWESAANKGIVELEVMRGLPLRPAARALCDEATPWSDSGLESVVPPRLRFLRLPIRPQVWVSGHRVDFLIGDRLVLQIDGGTHVGPQREQDIAHDAMLTLMGYHVIRVGYGQVVNRWHEVQDLIMRAVAQRLHVAR